MRFWVYIATRIMTIEGVVHISSTLLVLTDIRCVGIIICCSCAIFWHIPSDAC